MITWNELSEFVEVSESAVLIPGDMLEELLLSVESLGEETLVRVPVDPAKGYILLFVRRELPFLSVEKKDPPE